MIKSFIKSIVLFLIITATTCISYAKAQEKYSFATWTNVYDQNSSGDRNYLMFSLWSSKTFSTMTKETQAKWLEAFKGKIVQNLGSTVVKSYDSPISPYTIYENLTFEEADELQNKLKKRFEKDYDGFKDRSVMFMTLSVSLD